MSDPSAVELATRVRAGEARAVELVEEALERIHTFDRPFNAIIHVAGPSALARAKEIDAARASGAPLGPLAGVPVVLKDNIAVRGLPLTAGSRILDGYVSPFDAHVVEQLRKAGAIIVAKSNMDEFAMGSSTENSAFGACRNPWDPFRSPGGSSGGSAVAVAAHYAPLALGSDTGGSVRQPGAFTGIVALKPTYGRVSRYGLVAFASSLDQIGPMARTIEDTAALLHVIAGHDIRDATSADVPVDDYGAVLGAPAPSLRVGYFRDELGGGVDPEVRAACERVRRACDELGWASREISLPHARYALAAYYVIAPAEASSNLARFDGMRYGLRVAGDGLRGTYARTRGEGFGPEVKRRIVLGTYALSAGYYDAYYLRAEKVRTLVRRDYAHAFREVDILVSPTAPTTAFPIGERIDDPVRMYHADVFTLPASLAGVPAINIPAGFSNEGLPLGVQLTGNAFREADLLRAAHAIMKVLGSDERVPPLMSAGPGGVAETRS